MRHFVLFIFSPRLDSVRKRFIQLVGCQLGYGYNETPIGYLGALRASLGLWTLLTRRTGRVLLHNMLSGDTDCLDLLALVDLRVSAPRGPQRLLASTLPTALHYELLWPTCDPYSHTLYVCGFLNCGLTCPRKTFLDLPAQ